MSSAFELHVGFPSGETAAEEFFALIKQEKKGWNCSEVDAVHTPIAEFDPHNVPGTLRYLISKSFSRESEAKGEVLAEAQWVLSTLRKMNIEDARLEIEFVFGYLTRRKNDENGGASLSFSEVPAWPREKLQLQHGELIETPNSEIHFILERDFEGNDQTNLAQELTIEEAGDIFSKFDVKVQQTIEYRSQSMRDKRRQDKKLICTAYYGDPSEAERVARDLYVSSRLCEDVMARGYMIRMVLERILGCFKPIFDCNDQSASHESGMECALTHS